MKKIIYILFFILSFSFFNNSYSESNDSGKVIATVNLYDFEILSQENNIIKMQFDLSNREYIQPGVKYGVRLTKEDGDIINEKVYDDIVNLGENVDIIKNIEYGAPDYLNGKYKINIIAKSESGLTLAISRSFEVILNGSNDYVEIIESSCYLKIEGFDEKYNVSQGVDITSEEILIATCKVKNNSDTSKKLVPYFKTFLRNTFGDEVNIESETQKNLDLNAKEEKEISFILPNAKKPQAYDTKLTIKDKEGKEISNEINFHYVVSGNSATIQNIRLNKDYYNKGENVVIDFLYSKSASNFVGARNDFIKDEKLFFILEIKNNNNEECIDKTKQELTDLTQINITLPVINDCTNPSILGYIKDINGNILDTKEYNIKSENLPTQVQTKEQIETKETSSSKSTSSKNLTNIIIIAFVLILLIIIITYYLFKNKKKNTNTIIQIIFVFIFAGLFSSNNEEVNADSMSNAYMVMAGQYRFSGINQSNHNYTITANFDKRQYKPGERVYVSSNSISVTCENSFLKSTLNIKNNGNTIKTINFNDDSSKIKNIQELSFTAPSTPGNYNLEFELVDDRCRNSGGMNSGYSPSGYNEWIYVLNKTSQLNYINKISTWNEASTLAAILKAYPTVKAHYDARAIKEGVRGNHVYCDKLKTSVKFNYSVVAEVISPTPTPTPTSPTPTPVINNSNSYGGACSSYISGYSPNWGNCEISSEWSTNGSINCTQINTWSPVYSGCGVTVYKTTTSCVGKTCTTSTSSSCDSSSCPGNTPKPANQTDIKTISMNINSPVSQCSGIYANNSDECKLKITISGVTNQDRAVTGWGERGILSNFTDISNQGSDRITGGGKALNFTNISNSGPISGKGDYYINGIKSRSPFTTNTGKISFKAGNTTLNLNNIFYSFKKPLIGKIQASSDNGITWIAKPLLGTLIKYKLSYINNGISGAINSYYIENFVNKIEGISSNLEIQDQEVDNSTLDINGSIFSARINTGIGIITQLPIPGLQVLNPIISYNLGGQNVKYYLSEKDEPDDTSPIKITGEEFLGVKVIGILQGDGKQTITGQNGNFSDLSSFQQRTNIRKNAYLYIKNMKSGDILNDVKYIQGQDIKISGNLDYETLVVKDGNVIIEGDLNTNGKKLGIIVIKDNYNINSDYNTSGNIYINSNVKYINAILYSDGGIISSKDGVPYLNDSTSRTYDLNKQLIINGSIFSRNTIGGAILSGGDYLLPGKSITNNFNLAMIYDLNYLRRGNSGCDNKNGDGDCKDLGEYNDSTIIIYNSSLNLNAPKLFY